MNPDGYDQEQLKKGLTTEDSLAALATGRTCGTSPVITMNPAAGCRYDSSAEPGMPSGQPHTVTPLWATESMTRVALPGLPAIIGRSPSCQACRHCHTRNTHCLTPLA